MRKSLLRIAFIVFAGAVPAVAAAQVTALPEKELRLKAEARDLFSVGTVQGEEWEMFDGVAAVAFDAAGNLYILDRGNARVIVYSRDGDFLRQIGKKGGGPGELQLPLAMTVARDGSVVVLDLARGAFSLFDPAGTFVENIRFGDTRPTPDLTAHPAGGFVYLGSNFGGLREGGPPAVPDSVPLVWRRSAAAEDRVLLRASSAKPLVRQSGSAGNQRVMVGPPPLFTPTVRWALLPNAAVAIADDASHTVRVYDRQGRLQRTIRGRIEPPEVSDKVKEEARAQRKALLEGGGGVAIRVEDRNGRRNTSASSSIPAEQVERMLAEMTFAATIPVVRRIAADREGRLWIERVGENPLEPGPIDIVDSRGVYSGTLRGHEIPDAFGPSRLAAYILQDEETGVDRVVVRELPW